MTGDAVICDRVRRDLGGFVLSGLDAAEHDLVAGHLNRCPACRHEYARLRDLPALMALTLDAPPAPPPSLRGRVLRDAVDASTTRHRRTRRRRVLQLAAALALGVVLGGVGVWSLVVPAPDPAVEVALDAGQGFTTDGSMRLLPTDNGVTVDLDLRGLPDLGADEVYEVWFGADGGPPLSVGTFRPDAAGTADVTLSAAGPVERYDSVWITLEPDFADPSHDGPTVVAAPLP